MLRKFKELLENEDLFDIAAFFLMVVFGIFVLAITVVIIVAIIKVSQYNINVNDNSIACILGGLI